MSPSSARVPVPALLAVAGVAVIAAGAALVPAAWLLEGRDDGPSLEGEAQVGAAGDDDGWTPWARNDDGAPVRWNPCSPIELVVNPRHAHPGFDDDLADAVDEIAEASGLDLRVVDEVDETPVGDRDLHQPARYGDRWAPVLVATAAPGENALPLRDTDRAVAVPVAVGPAGSQVLVGGQIVLNRERTDVASGSSDRADSWGAILRHELGHLLGLDHVDDPEQLMHAHPGPGDVQLGDGDRRGLAALGSGGCIDVPPPGPVDVDVAR